MIGFSHFETEKNLKAEEAATFKAATVTSKSFCHWEKEEEDEEKEECFFSKQEKNSTLASTMTSVTKAKRSPHLNNCWARITFHVGGHKIED